MQEPNITVFGAPWCPDCRRSKQFLGEQRIPFVWVDIDQDEEGRTRVQEVNGGKQIIPTIVFQDGSILVEPSNAELAAKLGISPKAKREFTTSSWSEGACRVVSRPLRCQRRYRNPDYRTQRSGWPGRPHGAHR